LIILLFLDATQFTDTNILIYKYTYVEVVAREKLWTMGDRYQRDGVFWVGVYGWDLGG
jgi:hypothetical protein